MPVAGFVQGLEGHEHGLPGRLDAAVEQHLLAGFADRMPERPVPNRSENSVMAVSRHRGHEQLPVGAVDDSNAPRQKLTLERQLDEPTLRGHREHADEGSFPARVIDGPRHEGLAVLDELGGEVLAARLIDAVAIEQLLDRRCTIENVQLNVIGEGNHGATALVLHVGERGDHGGNGKSVVLDPAGSERHVGRVLEVGCPLLGDLRKAV
ncbi:MAG: hypothetical protein QG626_10 [Patescibacteria group bacterium]|nr:hypothetical protein [Patescibacteria group bacterium]